MKFTDQQLIEAMSTEGFDKVHFAVEQDCHIRSVEKRIAKLAHLGFCPEQGLRTQYPDGFKMGKVTIQRDANGQIERTWERMVGDDERRLAMMAEAIDELKQDITPLPPVELGVATVDRFRSDLLNLFVLTDFHLGMLAWGEETGDDWDLNIAEQVMANWFRAAVHSAPYAKKAVLCNLGDFMHFDGLDAVTPTSGHILDSDTRFTKLVRVAIRALKHAIGQLLETHEEVHVIMAEGNHDMASSVWLAEVFNELYRDNPRVYVETSPDPYYCVEHGDTSLFFHHGHKRKMDSITPVFAAKFREVFGRTKHSYAHTGHLHHQKVLEDQLMITEQHRTLAAKDAYASRGGWLSGRDAKVITYSNKYGEVARTTISPDMVYTP